MNVSKRQKMNGLSGGECKWFPRASSRRAMMMDKPWKPLSSFLVLLLISVVVDLPSYADARDVRSPTPTNEYHSSFFQPSSSDTEVVDDDDVDAAATNARTMTTTPRSNLSGRDGIVDLVEQLAEGDVLPIIIYSKLHLEIQIRRMLKIHIYPNIIICMFSIIHLYVIFDFYNPND